MNTQKSSISDEVRHIHVPDTGAHFLYFPECFEGYRIILCLLAFRRHCTNEIGKDGGCHCSLEDVSGALELKALLPNITVAHTAHRRQTGKAVARWVSLPPPPRDFI